MDHAELPIGCRRGRLVAGSTEAGFTKCQQAPSQWEMRRARYMPKEPGVAISGNATPDAELECTQKCGGFDMPEQKFSKEPKKMSGRANAQSKQAGARGKFVLRRNAHVLKKAQTGATLHKAGHCDGISKARRAGVVFWFSGYIRR